MCVLGTAGRPVWLEPRKPAVVGGEDEMDCLRRIL